MRIETSSGKPELNRIHLDAVSILKYFLAKDEQLETLIMCGTGETGMSTTDFELYQALGSLKSYDAIHHAKLVKFLENVEVVSYTLQTGNRRAILTHEQVARLRELALKSIGGS
jgi:hypothetical protein